MNVNTAGEATSDLRYLDAGHVEHPSGTFAGVEVCNAANEQLGSLDGVLIEPSTRRIRYFVVDSRRGRGRCVLTADTPAVLDFEDKKLMVEARPRDLQRLGSTPMQPFCDDDLIDALFSRAS